MAEQGQEQNRTEDATPFKLRKARERGMVARGLDLGFVASLVGIALFAAMAGERMFANLAGVVRTTMIEGMRSAGNPRAVEVIAAQAIWPAIRPVALFGGTLIALVLLIEIVQLRGLMLSTAPLKPDFSRLNPAQGLKRIFSMRMLKEAGKSIAKMAVYTIAAVLTIRAAITQNQLAMTDAPHVVGALRHAGTTLVYVFLAIAVPFAVLDQIIARGSFASQMRMSRREVTREVREREGEPRIKSKRKQLHAAFVKQSKSMANLPGSDMLIVNPVHFAVALKYQPSEMDAPIVSAKGADRHAAQLKARALQLGIPVLEVPLLARALFASTALDQAVPGEHYHAIADLYLKAQKGRKP